jgi:hypothetical protein
MIFNKIITQKKITLYSVREKTEKYRKKKKKKKIYLLPACVSMRVRVREERERGAPERITSSTASCWLEFTGCNSQRREGGGGGKRRKSRVLFLIGSGCLIQYFSLYFFWCDNPMCLILIDGYKEAGLHQLLIEVILIVLLYKHD